MFDLAGETRTSEKIRPGDSPGSGRKAAVVSDSPARNASNLAGVCRNSERNRTALCIGCQLVRNGRAPSVAVFIAGSNNYDIISDHLIAALASFWTERLGRGTPGVVAKPGSHLI